jgi:alkylation response protein AidB-like acyl-CoA dehydrogenase
VTEIKDVERSTSFAEEALRMGGKTEDEAKRTGVVDRADDQVETLFAPEYKTVNSPIHRAVWDNITPLELFSTPKLEETAFDVPVIKNSLALLKEHKAKGTLYDELGKVSPVVIDDLSKAGYWGAFIAKEYGGQGLNIRQFMTFLGKVATIEPMYAALASVHGCIGAVDPLNAFGSEEQKRHYLPKLASGEMLSAFALTEPGAGSDLTALKTKATLVDDYYLVNGEKLFITNALPGRTIGLVCLIENKPAVLIAELPAQENENFQIVHYGLHAVKRLYNNGLKFKDFKVPKGNLLVPPVGDGLTIAYHGLNLGRLALCSASAAVMKVMLVNLMPWIHFRKTYGQTIDRRELVKRRVAQTASLIAGSEALVAWGSWLLDKGYRGELECIIAKIFGSESQKQVAIEYFMKTHGGRSFLQGHLFGDNVHEFLAPCIYEGEGEMLGMAFFKSLAKAHGVKYFEPVGKSLEKHKMKTMNPFNPLHGWALRNELIPYAFWYLGKLLAPADKQKVAGLSPVLQDHVDFALAMLGEAPFELSENMVKHQLKLADRQCRIADLSQSIQDIVVILVTALWAHQDGNKVVQAATDILCQDLRRKITGEKPSDKYFRRLSQVADLIMEEGYPGMSDIDPASILFSY